MTYHMQATLTYLEKMAMRGTIFQTRGSKPLSKQAALREIAELKGKGYNLFPCPCNPKPPGRCPGFKRV